MATRVAVASRDGVTVHQHFGRATHFQIYDLYGERKDEAEGSGFSFVETRENEPSCRSDSGEREEEAHAGVVRLLADCQVVLAARIGPGAFEVLNRQGLKVYETPMDIDRALERLIGAEARKIKGKGGV
ncbi:MAG: dinitrogenase iron-molybdenum cofactor biosynthesis protein [Deltaproteobacteria bacterium]|nr:dinitrogenase iron-molybdenum cofactor biosynthesis protein [Deltaproteobacteria bacterium]